MCCSINNLFCCKTEFSQRQKCCLFSQQHTVLFGKSLCYFAQTQPILSLQKQDLQKFSRNTFTIIAENNYNFLKYNFCCKNDSSDCFRLYSIYMEPTCCLKLRMQGSKTCPQTEETGERLNTSNRQKQWTRYQFSPVYQSNHVYSHLTLRP